MLVCIGIGRFFSRKCTSKFLKKFFLGGKRGEIYFLPLTTKKTAFFVEMFQNPARFRHPRLCVGKVRATPLKTGAVILNSEIFAESYMQNEIFCRSIWIVFLFLHCAALNSYIYLCVGNTIAILTADNLQVAAWCFVLSLHSGV